MERLIKKDKDKFRFQASVTRCWTASRIQCCRSELLRIKTFGWSRNLDGKLGKTIFRAVPRRPETLLYWHLDNPFTGATQTVHQQAIQPSAGQHRVTVVDEAVNQAKKVFEVRVTVDQQ
ncbi:MAG: hypothetical protein HC889_13385 [Synechococcaceae cyanobacterium SM1_2_3]|nr:hypothetical protein [Synechococcaceae cyanobacterium SM1_2_3]